jgi:ribosomal protein S19
MKRKISQIFVIVLVAGSLASCGQSEYTKLVKRELAKNVRYDSLFLTFKFNDTQTDFYTKGWEQNRLGLIRQGPKNQNVEYMMKSQDTTKSNIQMLFFPEFDENQLIKKMEMYLKYTAWSPVSKGYKSDVLLPVAIDTLMNWYGGNEFMEVKFPKDSVSMWVKVDGNRQISLTAINEAEIKAVISDLTWEKPKPKDNSADPSKEIPEQDQNM